MKFKCLGCGNILDVEPKHHELQWCKCKKSAVDYEEYSLRLIGKIEVLK